MVDAEARGFRVQNQMMRYINRRDIFACIVPVI